MTRIFACRPKDISRLVEIMDGLPVPPVYTDSIEGTCARCKQEIWIGPKVQAASAEAPDGVVLCFICAVFEHRKNASEGGTTDVVSLGNREFG